MSEQNESRIAIRFGGAPASKAPKSSPRPAPSSNLGKRQRPRFSNDDDSDGEDSEDAQPETITHFGANGAEYVDEERIRKDRQRADDLRNASRRIESPADSTQEKQGRPDKSDDGDEEGPLKYGLTIAKKPKPDEILEEETKEEDVPRIPKTADEEAMDVLMGKETGKQRLMSRNEDDAYRDAAASAPEVDDLATYDAIPVEGFGASLLIGQGWDGKMRGPKAKEITRRPNGMGLGAKKLKAEEDLGAWDSKGKGKGKSDRRPGLDEYRRERDKERSRREDRYRGSYKNERERDRDRDRHGDRGRDRDRESYRHRDSDHRR